MSRYIQLGPVPVGGVAPIIEECEKQGWNFVDALYCGIIAMGLIQQSKFHGYFILLKGHPDIAMPDLKSLGIELDVPPSTTGYLDTKGVGG